MGGAVAGAWDGSRGGCVMRTCKWEEGMTCMHGGGKRRGTQGLKCGSACHLGLGTWAWPEKK